MTNRVEVLHHLLPVEVTPNTCQRAHITRCAAGQYLFFVFTWHEVVYYLPSLVLGDDAD